MFHVKQKRRLSPLFYTRLMGLQNLPESLTPLKNQFIRRYMLAQSLLAAQTISVCCAQHFLWRAYPNGWSEKPVSSARAAISQSVRKQMLTHNVHTAHTAFLYPNDGT